VRPGFKVSRFQGFKVSRFQGFKVSKFQSFQVSKFQCFKVSILNVRMHRDSSSLETLKP
jgi:hypothetical protein